MASDKYFMERALQLAQRGLGFVSPNPMVGCVVAQGDQILSEGFHQQFGGPHAEVHALNNLQAGTSLSEATVYVTLEPCSHHGKTPPCAQLLAERKPARVVVAQRDPNPQVNGRGLSQLRGAGIEVQEGILEAEARRLNRRFLTNQAQRRPYILLKWAQTHDGFLARSNYQSKWISSEESRRLVHQWRSEEDAVLVGYNTAHYDNPQLTVRMAQGRNPTRLLWDPGNQTAGHPLKLFDEQALTIRLNQHREEPASQPRLLKAPNLSKAIHRLYDLNIGSILVEGGAATLRYLIQENLWDEARIFTAPVNFAEGISAPQLSTNQPDSDQLIGPDQLKVFFRNP